MTFYLCTTGIHTQLTSGRGKKEATLKPHTLKAAFEGLGEVGGRQVGDVRKRKLR